MKRSKKSSDHTPPEGSAAAKTPSKANSTSSVHPLDRLDDRKIVIGLVLLCCLAYANSLGGDFVFDDVDVIVKNQDLRSWGNLGRGFTSPMGVPRAA